jgi:hypothetical protein
MNICSTKTGDGASNGGSWQIKKHEEYKSARLSIREIEALQCSIGEVMGSRSDAIFVCSLICCCYGELARNSEIDNSLAVG